MKGIILAGGSGSRLLPLTSIISKQLLPVYDKPMIYYPLCTLLLADIKDILIISTPNDLPNIEKAIGDGSRFGITISYLIQPQPEGIAQAFLLAEEFISKQPCALILGDNIFYGNGLSTILKDAVIRAREGISTLFSYYVAQPQFFGVLELHGEKPLRIEEKPAVPKSNYIVTGLYFYNKNVIRYVKELIPSERNELEITDLNNIYLQQEELYLQILGRGYVWMDLGTPESLFEASQFIYSIESRHGIITYSPEEISFRKGWIDRSTLLKYADLYGNTKYGVYLKCLANGKILK